MANQLVCVGPVSHGELRFVGGTTRSFELLVEYLSFEGIKHVVVPTNRYSGPFSLVFNFLYVVVQCVLALPRANTLFLNGSLRSAVYLAPTLKFLTKAFGKRFAFRMFGGDLAVEYDKARGLAKKSLDYGVIGADQLYLQTRSLVSRFDAHDNNVFFLPTSRPAPAIRRDMKVYKKRIVYLGHIKPSKGIDHVLKFRLSHNDSFTVNLYGPISDSRYENLTEADGYMGVLTPDNVPGVLSRYDVLVLPTSFQGEGYPGVLIEANAIGLPVVTTDWQDISEIVKNGESGLLLPANDYKAFENALLSFNDQIYQRMSKSAVQWSKQFDVDLVCGGLVSRLLA